MVGAIDDGRFMCVAGESGKCLENGRDVKAHTFKAYFKVNSILRMGDT
jgi:hypothetical protein